MPFEPNRMLLQPRADVVVELHFFSQPNMDHGRDDWLRALRYFSLIETQNATRTNRLDGVWFAGRMSIDQNYHSTFYYCTYIVPAPVFSNTQPKIIREIIHDYSISQNVIVKQHNGKYYAFGGEDKSGEVVDGHLRIDDRDGVRVLEADSFEALQTNWLHPLHRTRSDSNVILPGNHSGCVTARYANGICEYDSLLSAVFLHGRWHIHVRANLKFHGGRFVQMARSTGSSPYGPYEPFQLISIADYDPTPGSGEHQYANIYYLSAHVHPLDDQMMIGLMPINWGVRGQDNGDGESAIAMVFSCDGLHWSEIANLVKTRGIQGRTYDHPVSGLILHNGVVYWYLHRDVPNISPNAQGETAILEYAFQTEQLMMLTRAAKLRLASSCRMPPQSPSPPQPKPPPPSNPPVPLSPPPSPSPVSPPPPTADQPSPTVSEAPPPRVVSPPVIPSPILAAPPPQELPPMQPPFLPAHLSATQYPPSHLLAAAVSIACVVLFTGRIFVRRWLPNRRGSSTSARRDQGMLVELSTPTREAPGRGLYDLNDAALAAAATAAPADNLD